MDIFGPNMLDVINRAIEYLFMTVRAPQYSVPPIGQDTIEREKEAS